MGVAQVTNTSPVTAKEAKHILSVVHYYVARQALQIFKKWSCGTAGKAFIRRMACSATVH